MVTDWVLDVVYVISPLHLPAIDGASDCDGCDGCVGVDPDESLRLPLALPIVKHLSSHSDFLLSSVGPTIVRRRELSQLALRPPTNRTACQLSWTVVWLQL